MALLRALRDKTRALWGALREFHERWYRLLSWLWSIGPVAFFWAALMVLTWLRRAYYVPIAGWLIDTTVAQCEEGLKTVFRELYAGGERFVNFVAVCLGRVFMGRDWHKHGVTAGVDSDGGQSALWAFQPTSLNAIVARRAGSHGRRTGVLRPHLT